MNPISIILGGLKGALDAASGGAIPLDKALKQATAEAAYRPDVPVAPKDAKAVAEAVAKQMPAPQAMEPLWPQVLRQLLVLAGGVLVGTGKISPDDAQTVIGAVTALAPILWRIGTTLIARRRAA